MKRLLNLDAEALARFCEAHHIRRLSLFGSQLKGTARPDSDVDLLVEFLPDARPTLLDMAQMEIELSQALGGAESRSAYRPGLESPFPRRGGSHGRGAVCRRMIAGGSAT